MNQHCSFYPFLQAVQGNWRNAIFIQCSCAICPCAVSQSCQGFLLAVNAEGKPLLASVLEISRLTGENIDPSECRGILERQAFEAVYHLFIDWHTNTDRKCVLLQLTPSPHCQ